MSAIETLAPAAADEIAASAATPIGLDASSLLATHAPSLPVSPASIPCPFPPSAVTSYWPFAAVCQFFELFHAIFPETIRFQPESVLAALECDRHEETHTKAVPAHLGGHTVLRCRCHASQCDHLTSLHVALLKLQGKSSATNENWRKLFDLELNQRPDDWPLLWALQKTHPHSQSNEINEVPDWETDDSSTLHPLCYYHYYHLPPTYKCALLHLHCCWLLNDDKVREMISAQSLHVPAPFGSDDSGDVRYWLYLHSGWDSGRVHFYRELKGTVRSRVQPHEYKFELMAVNREQLDAHLAMLMSSPSQSSSSQNSPTSPSPAIAELVRRINVEILPELDRESKLLQRRQRRQQRTESDIDWSAFMFDDNVGRTRRSRKRVNYRELEEGDIDNNNGYIDDGDDDDDDGGGEYVDQPMDDDDDDEQEAEFGAADYLQTRYETRRIAATIEQFETDAKRTGDSAAGDGGDGEVDEDAPLVQPSPMEPAEVTEDASQ